MIESTLQNARELCREIWEIPEQTDQPGWSLQLGRFSERLSNIGVVLLYGVAVGYLFCVVLAMLPESWRAQLVPLQQKWWFWVGTALVVLTLLRLGLDVTKLLKRWNIASLIGALLLLDFLVKAAPPLFGLPGFSPVDGLLGKASTGELGQLIQKALGL